MRLRSFSFILLLTVLLFGMSANAGSQTLTHVENGVTETVEGSWVRKNKHYLFQVNDGSILKGWLIDGSKKYYCEQKRGYRLTGLKAVDGVWYFFRKNGSAAVSMWYANGKLYRNYTKKASRYFGKDGASVTGNTVITLSGNAQPCVFSREGKYDGNATKKLRKMILAEGGSLNTPLEDALKQLGLGEASSVMKMGAGTDYPLCVGDGIGNRYFYDGFHVDSVFSNSIECFLSLDASNQPTVGGTAEESSPTANSSYLKETGGVLYLYKKDGSKARGWALVGNSVCYASANGAVKRNCRYSGISFDAHGRAKPSASTKLMQKCLKILRNVDGESRSRKLSYAWSYLSGFHYSSFYPSLGKKGWQRRTALQALNSNGGNCYGYACAFAALAWAAGCKPYVQAGRVPGSRDQAADGYARHCWVRINGCYYDPELYWANTIRFRFYGSRGFLSHQVSQTTAF